jgi:uncharacterized membrane protein
MKVKDHPLVQNANDMQQERLSATERFCRRIADATGAPTALLLAIVVQTAWLLVGTITHWDPFPFVFLLTCSNVIQLILIFVIAVAQRQQTMHDELRAEADHEAISRLLYHQEYQEQLLLRIAERTGIDVTELRPGLESLAAAS